MWNCIMIAAGICQMVPVAQPQYVQPHYATQPVYTQPYAPTYQPTYQSGYAAPSFSLNIGIPVPNVGYGYGHGYGQRANYRPYRNYGPGHRHGGHRH
jgi:hypothetical protein